MSTTTIKIEMSERGMAKLNDVASAMSNDAPETVAAILFMRALDEMHDRTEIWSAYRRYVEWLKSESSPEVANDDDSDPESDAETGESKLH